MPPFISSISRLATLATLLALAACVSMEPPKGPPRKETVFAATAAGELIRFKFGRLYTLDTACGTAFDIADVSNAALAALRRGGVTRLHRIDPGTGRVAVLGRVANGQALAGLAIEP